MGCYIDDVYSGHRTLLFNTARFNNPLEGSLVSRFANSSTTAKEIRIQGNVTADGTGALKTKSSDFTYLTITEVAA